jgi:RNA polymerase sigma-70 factor (ECF subfamily)
MADTETLFAANHTSLFRYFCRAVGRAEIARDLTQEVFLRVSRASIPATAAGDLRGWLVSIARNLPLDHHRATRRHPEHAGLAVEPARSPSQDIDLAVHDALAALAPVDRDVFLMREVAGLGYDVIAAACELTPDAVRSRIHRTRLQLREQLSAPIATTRTMAMSRSGRTSLRTDTP